MSEEFYITTMSILYANTKTITGRPYLVTIHMVAKEGASAGACTFEAQSIEELQETYPFINPPALKIGEEWKANFREYNYLYVEHKPRLNGRRLREYLQKNGVNV